MPSTPTSIAACASWTDWTPLSTMGPSQFSRKNAMSSHVRNEPELASRSHPVPSANASRAASSPAARRARNASMSSGNAGRSSGRGASARPSFDCRCMKTGSDVPTCTPTPAAKGRYAVSRSWGRQPSRKVSSVMTSAVNPAALARRRSESVTSFVRGLLAPHREEYGKASSRDHGREVIVRTNRAGTSDARRRWPLPLLRSNACSRSTW